MLFFSICSAEYALALMKTKRREVIGMTFKDSGLNKYDVIGASVGLIGASIAVGFQILGIILGVKANNMRMDQMSNRHPHE